MAHTFVQRLRGAQSSGVGASQSLTFAASPTNGNALWAICQNEDNSATPVSCSDDRGNTWTLVTTINGSASAMFSNGPVPVKMAAAFCSKVTAGGATTAVTFTWSGGTSRKVMFIGEASGFGAAGAALDQCIGRETYGPANKISAGTFATFAQSEVVMAMLFSANRNPTSLDAGWTADATIDSFNFGRSAYGLSTSTTGISASWTIAESSAVDHCVVALALKDAPTAPTISSPTGASITATGITAGFTTDTASAGTCYFLRRVGGSAASAATIVSSGESQAATANPQTRAMTGFTAGTTSNYVDMVHANSGNSNVVTYGPFTMLPAFAGTIPAKSGTNGTAFAWGSPSEASYFTGATSYSTTPALTLGLSINSGTGAITGTLSSVSSWTGVINGTNSQGSAASNSFTITSNAAVPTINTQPTAQTVSEGAAATYTVSATSSGGALSYQWQRQAPGGGAFSNVGTSSASYTTAATVCATDHGAQLRVQVTDSNGTTQSSTVGLTVNATSSTSRPAVDVTVSGWTASTGSDLFAMIDESSPADGDYITSPGLSGSTAPATFALAYPLASGGRVVGVRARTDTGTATLRVYLLNDAGTVMGTTADQAINSTFATYSLAVTLSGPATRARIEVVV